MNQGTSIIAAAAAFFSGRGYYVNSNFVVPGTEISVDVAAVMPRMRELKMRLKRGFAPTGVINHLIGKDWVELGEIVGKTGYALNLVGTMLEDAASDGWVEMKTFDEGPVFRIKDYRIPARECILAFLGAVDLDDKLKRMRNLEGCFNRAMMIFPFDIDNNTTESIVSAGAGVVRYHQVQGLFQELIPAEPQPIKNERCFAMLVEKVLFDNVEIMARDVV